MKYTLPGLAVIAMAVSLASAQHVRPQVKTGLWEQTTTSTQQGAMPLPDSVLANLTPEQRARVEAQMRERQQPKTTTYQSCLTEKDLDDLSLFEKKEGQCRQTQSTSTGTQVDAQWECKMEQGISGKGTLHIDILGPESARGTVHVVIDGNGKHMVSDSRMTSRWLGPDCSKMRD